MLLQENVDLLNALLPLQQTMRELAGGSSGAEVYGSELLMHLTASLMQRALPGAEDLPVPLMSADKLMALHLTHSSNMEFLRQLLQVEWKSSLGWPRNYVGPGDMIVFELYGPSVHTTQDRRLNDTTVRLDTTIKSFLLMETS